MADPQDELVVPAQQQAPPSSEGDELVQAAPAPEQKGFFGKLWDAAVQHSIQDILNFNAARRASDTAINEWVHGRFEGSGTKAALAAKYGYIPEPQQQASGVLGSIKAGFQGSATGLALRGELPSVTLDPNGAKWWEKQLAAGTQLVSDLPEMAGAAILATPTSPVGQGAAAFGTPTAIREALITAYSTGQATSVSDFINRTKLAFLHTAQDTTLGAVTAGAGEMVKPFAAAVPGAGGAATFASKALVPTTEGLTLATAGPALQGRLPERDDFVNAAVMLGGLHLARGVAEGLGNIYAQTGKTPKEVLADAQTDPTILEDLKAGTSAPESTIKPVSPDEVSPSDLPPAVQQELHTARQADKVNALAVDSGLNPEHWRPFDPEKESQADFVQNRILDAEDHPEAFQQMYSRIPETRGGKIINGDVVEMLVVGDANPKQGIEGIEPHAEEAFNIRVFRKMWADRLAQLPENGKVWVMAGAPGAGKSHISQLLVDEGHADLVFDGNGHTTGRLEAPVQDALKQGANVNIGLVTRDHPESVSAMEARALTELRRLNPNGMAEVALASAKHVQAFSETPNGQKVTTWVISNKTGAKPDMSGFEPGSPNVKPGLEHVVQKAQTVVEAIHAGTEAGLQDGSSIEPGSAGPRESEPGQNPASPSPDAAETSDIPRAYQALADQQAAQDAVPGTKRQPTLPNIPGLPEALTQELFQHPQRAIPGEPDPLEINLGRMNTSGAINAMFMRVTDLIKDQIRAQMGGGARPWSQVVADGTAQLAELLGGDKSIGTRQAGDMASDAEIFARKMILQQVARDMKARVKGMLALGENATEAQKAEFMASMERSSAIIAAAKAEYKGAGADIARALNAMKILKGTSEQADTIQDLMGKYAADPVKLAAMVDSVSDPAGVIKTVPEITKASTWQQAIEFWKAGLLGPYAWTKKGLSDTVMVVSRPLVDTIALAWNQLESPARRMSVAEPIARVIGNIMGVGEGLKRAIAEMKLESMGGPAENQGAIPGLPGEVVRYQFRPLKAITVLAQAIQEAGETYALAARRASAEGLNPATREFVEKVSDYAVNPSESDLPGIEKFGRRMTFGADLNEPGKRFQKMVSAPITLPVAGEVKPLQIVFPFTKIPINVFDEQTRLSPLAFLSQDWQADFNKGGPARSKALAEWTVGMGLTGLGLAWAGSGRISGAGDPDPNKRRVAMASGWQPYSIKIGDTWYSMKNIHPVGTLIGLTADIHEIHQFLTGDESNRAMATLGQAFAHSVTEQTMLQGMTMVVEALNSPEKGVEHLLQGYAGSLVPATVAQTASTLDPYQREIQSIRDAVMNRIPGLREDLPVRRDPYGEPIPNPDRLGIISPITESQMSTDKVRLEGERLGVGAKKAPATINLPTKGLLHTDLAKVPLTPEQRDIYGTEAGHAAYNILNPIVHSPAWEQTPDILKAKIYETAFEKGNRIGNNAALTKEQRTQQMQEVADEIRRRLEVPGNP